MAQPMYKVVVVLTRCAAVCLYVRLPSQARGWALELCAGIDDDGYSFNTAAYMFTVNIVLTETGLAAGPGFGLAPVALLFQYIKLLTTTGVESLRGCRR
jgi:hypothetical protein